MSQQFPDVMGTLRFALPDGTHSSKVAYGIGENYTDTTDVGELEIPPFLPPDAQYYSVINRPCDGEFAGDPCWWAQDYRAYPDSVTSGEVSRFSVEYEILIFNSSGGPGRMSILNPDWPSGVDSIHLVDAQLPSAFNVVVTGPSITPIEDPFTSRIIVKVYYNLSTLSVETETGPKESLGTLSLAPNPYSSGQLRLNRKYESGDLVNIYDSKGELVTRANPIEVGAGSSINVDHLLTGFYYLRLVGVTGDVKGISTLLVR